MTPDEMREICRRIYQEVFERGNMATLDELVAEDCIDSSPNLAPGIPHEGRDSVRIVVNRLREAMPDLRVRIHELITDGDTGVARVTFQGTHSGDQPGMPATNKQVSWDQIDIIHVREGQIREHYGIADMLGLLQQLGVAPPAG